MTSPDPTAPDDAAGARAVDRSNARRAVKAKQPAPGASGPTGAAPAGGGSGSASSTNATGAAAKRPRVPKGAGSRGTATGREPKVSVSHAGGARRSVRAVADDAAADDVLDRLARLGDTPAPTPADEPISLPAIVEADPTYPPLAAVQVPPELLEDPPAPMFATDAPARPASTPAVTAVATPEVAGSSSSGSSSGSSTVQADPADVDPSGGESVSTDASLRSTVSEELPTALVESTPAVAVAAELDRAATDAAEPTGDEVAGAAVVAPGDAAPGDAATSVPDKAVTSVPDKAVTSVGADLPTEAVPTEALPTEAMPATSGAAALAETASNGADAPTIDRTEVVPLTPATEPLVLPDVVPQDVPYPAPIPAAAPSTDGSVAVDESTGMTLPVRRLRAPMVFRRAKPRVRRVTRVVRHVDTWSVFKVALVFNVILYLVCLTSGVLLWNVAHATGTIDNIEKFFEQFGWERFEFKGGEIYHNAWIGGMFVAVGLTGFVVLVATLFNLITDLVGGIRISVLEEEVVVRQRPANTEQPGGTPKA